MAYTVVYVCTGECKAEIAEEQYVAGLQLCGAEFCSHKGQTFEKRLKCAQCGYQFKEEDKHQCKD